MAAGSEKHHKKLFKRLSKRFEGTAHITSPAEGEKKDARKAGVEVLTYVERGSFRHGVCPECRWEGPGRRAREKATSDYLAHAKGCPKR